MYLTSTTFTHYIYTELWKYTIPVRTGTYSTSSTGTRTDIQIRFLLFVLYSYRHRYIHRCTGNTVLVRTGCRWKYRSILVWVYQNISTFNIYTVINQTTHRPTVITIMEWWSIKFILRVPVQYSVRRTSAVLVRYLYCITVPQDYS